MLNILIKTESRYPVNRKSVRKAVEGVFESEKIKTVNAEISIVICGARKMKGLTDNYLKDNRVHEVLSFPLEDIASNKGAFVAAPDEVLRLGDVVVSWPEVLRLAAENDIFVDEEIAFLVAHGVEHLLGIHHEE